MPGRCSSKTEAKPERREDVAVGGDVSRGATALALRNERPVEQSQAASIESLERDVAHLVALLGSAPSVFALRAVYGQRPAARSPCRGFADDADWREPGSAERVSRGHPLDAQAASDKDIERMFQHSSMDEPLAWAAGLFDGEGSTTSSGEWDTPHLSVPQAGIREKAAGNAPPPTVRRDDPRLRARARQ